MNRAASLRLAAAVLLLAVLFRTLAFWAGFEVFLPWQYLQFLDPLELTERPFESLFLLHSQPPVQNTVVAVLLALEAATGISLEFLAGCVLVAATFAGAVFTALTAAAISSSPRRGLLAALLLFLTPGFHVFGHLFHYPAWVMAEVALVLWTSWRLLSRDAPADLWYSAATLGVLGLTRSLFHWAFLLGLWGALLWLRRRCGSGTCGPRPGPPTLLLCVLLLAWPTKNLVIFGHFTSSSWDGFNLTKFFPPVWIDGRALDFVRHGKDFPEAVEAAAAFYRSNPRWSGQTLRARVKSDGWNNWNHMAFLVTRRQLLHQGMKLRLEHPGIALYHLCHYYLRWGLPTDLQPFTGLPRRPGAIAVNFDRDPPPTSGVYDWMAAGFRALFFCDLLAPFKGGLSEFLSPRLDQVCDLIGFWRPPDGHRLVLPTVTLFAAVLFPLLMIRSILRLRRGGLKTPADGVLLVAVALVAWQLGLICLTDGFEANRMRFSVLPCLYLMAVLPASGEARMDPPSS